MKANDVFPSKYLAAADLGDKEPTVTIDRVVLERLGDENKPIMYFKDKQKGLVVNKTNWSMLEHICKSEESDDWAGHRVRLCVEMVPFQGKVVPSIRCKPPIRNTTPQQTRVEIDDRNWGKVSTTVPGQETFDDEIPDFR